MNLLNRFLIVLSFVGFLGLLAFTGQLQKDTRRTKKQSNLCDRKISQGIKGKILLARGNQMPGPDQTRPVLPGVSRVIGIFRVCRLDQTEAGQQAGFYKKIQTKMVARTHSNAKGCFSFSLPPGKYSFFVKEKGEWYANSFGPDGEVSEVVVKENEVNTYDFTINYAAFY